jgi:hypothetical protein
MTSEFAITSVSLIRNEAEAEVVLETIYNFSKLNIPVIICDGGSPEEYKKLIRKMPNVILSESPGGLTHQLVLSHREAAKYGKYLLYTQSDKLDFSRNTAFKLIETYSANPDKGVLIAARNSASLATYPRFQKTQEEFLNYFMGDYIVIPEDYYAGPKIYPASLVPYLDQLNTDIGWGIEAYFYAIAKRMELPFNFYDFFMRAPVDVDNPEITKKYRLQITKWQIEGLRLGQSVRL